MYHQLEKAMEIKNIKFTDEIIEAINRAIDYFKEGSIYSEKDLCSKQIQSDVKELSNKISDKKQLNTNDIECLLWLLDHYSCGTFILEYANNNDENENIFYSHF